MKQQNKDSPINMLIKQIYVSLKKSLKYFYELGSKNEKEESLQKYIVYLNIISIFNFSILIFTSILIFAFTTNKFATTVCLSIAMLLIFPVYFNTKGYYLFAKLYMCFATNLLVVVACCLFSLNPFLKNYFFSIILNCIFLYSYKELKWLFIAVGFSLTCYIIESTPLQHFLPSHNFEIINELYGDKMIIQFSSVLFIFFDVFTSIYISKFRENKLTQNQKMLEDTQHELQIQNEDLQTFSIAASHSLQTPIYVSKFFLSKVRKAYYEPSQKNSNQKSMVIIEESLNQMDQLVSGLFSYSRIIKIEEAYSTFNVADEFMLIKKRLEEKFSGRKVVIPSENISITTSQILFSIIIQNLADNGLKYNTSSTPLIKLHFQQKGNTVSFFVSDNGIGIEEKNFNKIFEPFKRLNPGSFEGNGLGLSGAKRAAERIGGKLFCRESSHSGSIFQLDIPVGRHNPEQFLPAAQRGIFPD